MLVLASRSPRRQEILRNAGIPFAVRPSDAEEVRAPAEPALDYVRRLAQAKAEAVWRDGDSLVVGADTVVVVDGDVLEKPRDHADARRMLQSLSGRPHHVITGICLKTATQVIVDSATTRVQFAELGAQEIDAYVASGEPMDKAGAYAIQGMASKFITRIEGCYFNVMGLPISLVYSLLQAVPKQVQP